MIHRWILLVLLSTGCVLVAEGAAHAECSSGAVLEVADAECTTPGADGGAATPTGDGHNYELKLVCFRWDGSDCVRRVACSTQTGEQGAWWWLHRDGLPFSQVCVADSDPRLGTVTPGQVLTAFRRLTWPQGTLVIQPPNGRTLVNFDTNFYSTSTTPQTQQVTLLGQRITIEATPSQYTWHFGDEEQLATSESGAPYPDLIVTHNYPRTGTFRPRLDLTYSGRFRVGNGPWRQIPGTATVAGTAQQLQAIEAEPKLVNPYGN